MQVKRYHAPNVQDALRAVREDLGPDALVLSSRIVAAPGPHGWFGRRLVELTVAASRTEVPETRQQDAVPAVRETWTDTAARELAHRLPAAALTAPQSGASPAAAAVRPSTGALGDRPQTPALKRLAPYAARDRGHAPIEVFIGAPGSGKTTTIMKIAARSLARAGMRLALATADASRAGAVEELRQHARVIGASLAVARSPCDLQAILEASSVPVLVDTDGRPSDDGRARDVLRFAASRPDARVHLVIAADMPLPALRAAYARYADGGPTRVVVTRIDRAASVDGVVSFLQEQPLPVSYLCAGPRVPEDLLLMTTTGSRAGWSS